MNLYDSFSIHVTLFLLCHFSPHRAANMLLRIHHKSTFLWTDDRKYILHIVFDTGKLYCDTFRKMSCLNFGMVIQHKIIF